MIKQISVGLMLSLAAMAQANDHENPSTTDGAFITMMVQSDDLDVLHQRSAIQ